MEAFEAFDAAEFDKAVDIMRPLRYSVQRIGGSHAQVKYRGSKKCAMYYIEFIKLVKGKTIKM